MKKILFALLFAVSAQAWSQELIRIFTPYSATHSGTPLMMRVIDRANQAQSTYRFVLEFRPGGNQLLALQAATDRSLAIIAPSFAEHVSAGTVSQDDFVPVLTLGEACWAVIAGEPLNQAREIVVGSVAPGNATHLTAMMLGERFNRAVVYVGFKSNNDALINMAGNNGVNMAIDRWEAWDSLRNLNPGMQVFAASCGHRLPQAPTVPTLREMGVDAPQVFNIVVAPRGWDAEHRRAVASVLQTALAQIPAAEVFAISGMTVPTVSTEQYYARSIAKVRRIQDRYRDQIQKIR